MKEHEIVWLMDSLKQLRADMKVKQAEHETEMQDPNINIWGQMGSLEAQYEIALISLNAIISVAEMSDEEVSEAVLAHK
jgi:predicted DNA-binding ArsR family transcriptional regulator